MLDCPAARYPRSLPAVLTRDETAHLARVYFEHVRPSWPLRYYGLLHFLGQASEEEFARTMAIVRRVQARVRQAFGPQFMLINDFFSLRSSKHRMFPDLHQDYDFWVHKHRCTGFNVWVLLDHHRMNYSFDVYDVRENRGMYSRLYDAHARSMRDPTRPKHRTNHTGTGLPHLDANAFLELRERGGVNGVAAAKTNFPLEPGDAFILRQPEVHRTDRHRLRSDQWRLALGFKVLERAPMDSSGKHFGPVSQDLAQLQVRCPGLMPPIRPGRPWPDVYGADLLPAYRASTEATGAWLGWVLSALHRLLDFYGGNAFLLLVPLAFAVVVLALARRAGR